VDVTNSNGKSKFQDQRSEEKVEMFAQGF
jgi:hypothetical protein